MADDKSVGQDTLGMWHLTTTFGPRDNGPWLEGFRGGRWWPWLEKDAKCQGVKWLVVSNPCCEHMVCVSRSAPAMLQPHSRSDSWMEGLTVRPWCVRV